MTEETTRNIRMLDKRERVANVISYPPEKLVGSLYMDGKEMMDIKL
jgi:hypothetical protein